jgi:exopolyphosphatase/guanosine-5'-triphosphate,3'-diphosphate pyrophosphatase
MSNFLKMFQKQTTYGAIDLGSNAMRALIARRYGSQLHVIRTFRVPLRLGEDVFNGGYISPKKMEATENAFIDLFHSFAAYGVTEVRAMATSAMRDALNGPVLTEKILKYTGIEIEIIRGKEEARLICEAVKSQLEFRDHDVMLMDIGGGSTELTLIKKGKIIAVKSFNVGTVRLLHYQNQVELEKKINFELDRMLVFIRENFGKKKRPEFFVGTGGNLRRIGKIRKKTLGRPTSQMATFSEISHMEDIILSMSYIERIRGLELTENQADVILPATMLTQKLMQKLKLSEILLPKVGLKEGILLSMQEEPPKRFILLD